ncbi:hypothetical protein [Paraburkholderia sediminicola]
MSLKVVKKVKANGGGNASKTVAIGALQNSDRQLDALTHIETADGAGKTQFKRLSRNFSH